MSHLTWLHLSDWHQRGKDFNQKVVRDKLIDDLTNRKSIDPRLERVDFVVFSGDLTFFGLPEEFEAARDNLLEPVLQAVGVGRDRLFMVPGNHDLQRQTITEMLPKDLLVPLNNDELVSKWLTDDKKRQRALEPFEAYTDFVTAYTGQPEPAYASVNLFNVNGVDVALLGLNSAWMCGRNKEANEVNDYGFIVVGEPQIHDSLAEIKHATVRIAVLHHPFKWLKGFEQSKIEKRLKQACHFILRGHEHEPDVDWSMGPQGECVVIPAGAAYEKRNANDARYVNSCNFVHLDLNTATGSIFFRKWNEKGTAWTEDHDTCKQGQYSFGLPKQLGVAKPAVSEEPHRIETAHQLAQEASYRRQTIEAFKDLSFKGLTATVRPILLPLEKVYVQLRAVAEVPESADEFTPEERRVLRWMEDDREGLEHRASDLREAQMRLDALRRERWTRDRLERFPIADALKDPKRRGLVILGDPGSGKTTLLHFLALVFARGPQAASEHLQLSGDEADRLPIFAPLAAYDDMLNSDPELTVQRFLAKYYAQRRAMPGLENLFDSAIENGRALILLDGMDEVLEEGRRKFVADQASAFIRALINRGNRVLLTSRIYGYRVAPLSVELPHVTVLDFRREEIEVFARQWNGAMAEWEYGDPVPPERLVAARNEEKALLDEIESNPGVERLAANPLLLSMLALLRRQVGRLPQQRIRLYALYLGTLIDAWEASRSPGARVDSPARPEAGRVELVLIPLALWLQQNKPSGTATEAEILTQIRAVFLREEGLAVDTPEDTPEWGEVNIRARKFLEDMRQYSGLLVERGQGVFGFRHLTFQEYYVGRALARMDATKRWELLQRNLHANRWREPILLAAAQLGNMQADEESCTKLVNQILEAGSPHEDILHRDLFLAADCAGDDINVHIATLRIIVERLKALTGAPVPTVAAESIRRLVNLGLLFSSGKPRLPEIGDVLVTAIPDFYSSTLGIDQFVSIASPAFKLFPTIREALVQKLNNEESYFRGMTIRALSGLLAEDRPLRQLIAEEMKQESYNVRLASIEALAGFVIDDDELRKKISEKLTDVDNDVRAAAIRAVSSLLSNDEKLREAVIQRLEDPHANVQAAAIHALTEGCSDDLTVRQLVIQRLKGTSAEVRVAAVQALGSLMPDHKPSRYMIVEMLNDNASSVQVAAIQALSRVLAEDSVAQQAVYKKLNANNASIRAAAIQAIVRISEHENSVLALLEHVDWHTRADVVQAMADRISGEVTFRDSVARVFDDLRCEECWPMRVGAIQALRLLLPNDSLPRKAIENKLNDEVPGVRAASIRVLAAVLPDDERLRQAVMLKLKDPVSYVKVAAIQALSNLLPQYETLREAVALTLNDESSSVRVAAIEALKVFLPKEQTLRGSIVQRLSDRASDVRIAAIHALAGFVSDDSTLHNSILRLVNDDSPSVQLVAIKTLEKSLVDTEEVWEAVWELLHNQANGYFRTQAIRGLAELMSENERLRVAIIQLVKDPESFVRAAAISAIAPLIPDDEPLRKLVLERLSDEWPDVRIAAINALTGLVSDGSPILEAVLIKIEDPNKHVRVTAMKAVAHVLPHETLLEIATPLLDDEDFYVRANSVEILGKFLPNAPSLFEVITKKLSDEWGAVQMAAVNALAPFCSEHNVRAQIIAALRTDDTELMRYALTGDPRRALTDNWGKWALKDLEGRNEAIDMLGSDDWRLRLSGADILRAGGVELVREAVPQLLASLENQNGLDSYPARIAAAEVLINDFNYCQRSLEVLLSALDYGAHPLVIVPMAGEIRTSAAVALGKLKAEEYRPEIVEKLRQTMQTERNPQVLDGLYNAILSLASAPA